MLSQDLKAVLGPFKLMIDRTATNPVYRAIEVGSSTIRACLSWGIVEAAADTGLDDHTSICVPKEHFLGMVQSLPKDQHITMAIKNSALRWACGRASGHLAPVTVPGMPSIIWPDSADVNEYPTSLPKSLEVGSIACHLTALQRIGLYGIVVDNREAPLTVSSSDNISLSTGITDDCDWMSGIAPVSILPPDGAELLAMMRGGSLSFDDQAWWYANDRVSCRVNLLPMPPARLDTGRIRAKYPDRNIVAPIPQESIDKFVKRAVVLAEAKREARVSLAVRDGAMILSFKEGAAVTEEYFLIEDATPDVGEVTLAASKLARALSYIDEIVLDYANDGILIFRGHKPLFEYLICARPV